MDVMQQLKESGLLDLIEDVKSKWTLRMQSDSFIMVVNKRTGEYVNWYSKDFGSKGALKTIATILDKHKSIQE